MTAPLLRYDLFRARRAFGDAFATVRDRLLLLVVTAFLLLWLRDAATGALPRLPPSADMLAVLAGPASFGWNRAALRRLAWFGETSLLASDALSPKVRLSYLACAQLPLLAALSVLVLFLSASTGAFLRPATVAFLSYAVGIALANASGTTRRLKGPTRRRRSPRKTEGNASAFRILLARQTFDAERPVYIVALLVAGAALATFAMTGFATSQPPAVRLAAALFPSGFLLVATARNAPEIVGLLAFAGYPPRKVAAFVCALPAANLAAVSTAFLLVRPAGWSGMIGALVLLHLFAGLVATMRAWLSPGRSARRVDLQVQLELAGLGIVAGLLPPFAPVVAAWRLWLIHRHYSNLLWIQT